MKHILTAALLLFVAASVVYIVAADRKAAPAASESVVELDQQVTSSTALTESADVRSDAMPAPAVVVYYFHGKTRCRKCLAMEEFAKRAVEQLSAKPRLAGSLAWRVINYDEPANEHFVTEFGLTSSSVVVARMSGREPALFKNLDKIWDLISDEEAFKAYVISETVAMMEQGS